MTYLQVTPEHLQAAAPSFKSYVVGDLNTGLTNVTNALSSTLGSAPTLRPFANEIEEIITGIRGVLECLDNALNRAYIGLQNAGTHYQGLDVQLANTLNQIDSTLSVFLGYQHPLPPPHMPGWVIWGGIILGEGVIDVLTLGAATPEELALDGGLAGGELGLDALGAGAASGELAPGSAQMLRELYTLAA